MTKKSKCKFCKNSNYVCLDSGNGDVGESFVVICNNCGAQGPLARTKRAATILWKDGVNNKNGHLVYGILK